MGMLYITSPLSCCCCLMHGLFNGTPRIIGTAIHFWALSYVRAGTHDPVLDKTQMVCPVVADRQMDTLAGDYLLQTVPKVLPALTQGRKARQSPTRTKPTKPNSTITTWEILRGMFLWRRRLRFTGRLWWLPTWQGVICNTPEGWSDRGRPGTKPCSGRTFLQIAFYEGGPRILLTFGRDLCTYMGFSQRTTGKWQTRKGTDGWDESCVICMCVSAAHIKDEIAV